MEGQESNSTQTLYRNKDSGREKKAMDQPGDIISSGNQRINQRLQIDDEIEDEIPLSHYAQEFRKEQLEEWDDRTYGKPLLGKDGLLRRDEAIFIPESHRRWILHIAHRTRSGHRRSGKMLKYIRRRYWWPEMEKAIRNYCDSCWTCAITDQHHGRPLKVTPYSETSLFGSISLDLIVGLPTTRRGHKILLVIIDHASRFMKAIPLRNKKESTIVEALWEHWISQFGFPNRIVSDQGSEFVNKTMKALLARNGIEHDLMAAYYHRSNGMIERANRSIQALLRKSIVSFGEQWDISIYGSILAYNSTHHSSTGASPFFLMFGQDPKNVVDFLLQIEKDPPVGLPNPQEVYERLTTWWEQKLKLLDKDQPEEQIDKPLVFKQGDLVLIPRRSWPAKSKLWTRWTGPHEVISQPSRTKLMIRNGFTGRTNSTHINEVFPVPHFDIRSEPGWRLVKLLEEHNIDSTRCFIPGYHELTTLPTVPSQLRDYDAILVPRCTGASWSYSRRHNYKVVKVKASSALLKEGAILQDYGTHDWELWIVPDISSRPGPIHLLSDSEEDSSSEDSSVEGCKDEDMVATTHRYSTRANSKFAVVE